MKKVYTPDQYVASDARCRETIAMQESRLKEPGLSEQDRDFRLSTLAVFHTERAHIQIALGGFIDAMESLCRSVDLTCQVYERHLVGTGTHPPNAGHFQVLLLALVTNQEQLVPSPPCPCSS